MEPLINCLHFLTDHQFIRNVDAENFVSSQNESILVENHILYCVGLINGERIVHAIKFLGKTSTPGIICYKVKWYNTACYPPSQWTRSLRFDSVEFWVRSGVALRKFFFLFQDRMSLFKSTFLFDPISRQYFRLSHLSNYLRFAKLHPLNEPIYSSPSKIYFRKYRENKSQTNHEDNRCVSLCKSLRKVLRSHNQFRYIEKEHPRLFEVINQFIH